MFNPFTLPVNWQALATFVAGLSAVAGAVRVARWQIELKKNEVRVALLNQRLDIIHRYRLLQNEWWQNAKLSEEKERDFRSVARDIEILFDDETSQLASKIFEDTIFQNAFSRSARLYSESQDESSRIKAVEDEHVRFRNIAEKLPQLEVLLVNATKVGHIFR